jgi:hypothetical protein
MMFEHDLVQVGGLGWPGGQVCVWGGGEGGIKHDMLQAGLWNGLSG